MAELDLRHHTKNDYEVVLMELKVNNLTKDFRKTRAVNQVNYTFHSGVYGLLGVNGAGKTTLMRMLTTLLAPTSGEITWDGAEVFKLDKEYRRLLGYLPQDFGVYPDFTVQDYLMYIATLKGIKPAAAKNRVQEMLHLTGMTQFKNKKMKALSGGMKRRAGIAQAVLNDPKILILDEPTAGLDPSERIRFRNLISELAADRIVLLSTHIVSDVESIAGQIILMKDGKFPITGTTEELIASCPDKGWICNVPRDQVLACHQKYRVANTKTLADHAELRILSKDAPMPGAVPEETTLEDVFLSCFGERSDGEYGNGVV